MTLDEFLQILGDFKPQKNGSYKARCPVHGDGERVSEWHLTVRVKNNRIDFKCWKGCSQEDILRTMGIGVKDLYIDSNSFSNSKRPDPYSLEAPLLLQHHVDHLKNAAISLEIILERGYRSIDASDPEMAKLGFSKNQQSLGMGILIPLHGVDGTITGYQFRPDKPREEIKPNGKPRKRKYEIPPKQKNRFDVLPRCRSFLGDPQVLLFETEGTKKGDSIVTAAEKAGIKVCVIVLTGVWNFRGMNAAGGKTLIPDFEYVAFNGRKNYNAFDSDADSNSNIGMARKEISGIAANKGAINYFIDLPDGPNNAKLGADDYFAQGHDFNDFIVFAHEPNKSKNLSPDDMFKKLFAKVDGKIGYYKSDEVGSHFSPSGDFDAQIAEVIIEDDGRDQKKYYRITGKDSRGIMLPDLVVPVPEYESMDWVNEGWDVRAVISPERKAKAQIAATLRYHGYDARRRTIYSRTGWLTEGDKHIFLTNGSAIGAPETGVDLKDDLLTGYSLPQPVEKFTENLQAGLRFLDIGSPDIVLPLFAGIFMAPLNPFFVTDFTLYLEGDSGTYKSGISAQALNFYGRKFSFNDFPGSWLSTENRLEHQMFTCQDITFCIDDLAPGINKEEAKILAQKADRIIREQANRSGRGRMGSDTTNRKTFFSRCFLMTSGEYLPSVHSATARTFVTEVARGEIDRLKLFNASDEKHLYPQVMTQYILWIAKYWNQLKSELPRQIRQWTNDALESNGEQHARLPAAVAMLYAGLNTALSFFYDNGAINQVKAEEIRKQGWDTLLSLSIKQTLKMESRDPAKQFIEALVSMRNQGRVVFQNIDADDPPAPVPGVTSIGWFEVEDGKVIYYLNPGASFEVAKQFCEHIDKPITVDMDTIWKRLLSMGYSEGSPETRNGKVINRTKFSKRIYGQKTPVIKIIKDVL